LGAARAL
jgi:hypothetical protein